MRVPIGAIALLCGMALPGEPNGLASHAHAQATDPCGWIGVAVSPITSAFAASLGMVEPYGAIFEQPDPGSPAANAGIQAGDVLTSVNGGQTTKTAGRQAPDEGDPAGFAVPPGKCAIVISECPFTFGRC